MRRRPATLEGLRAAERRYDEAVREAAAAVVAAGLTNRIHYLVHFEIYSAKRRVEIEDGESGDPILLAVYENDAGDDLSRLGIGNEPEEADLFLAQIVQEDSELDNALSFIDSLGVDKDSYVVISRGGAVERFVFTAGDPEKATPSELLRDYEPIEVFFDASWDVDFGTALALLRERRELATSPVLGATHGALHGSPVEWSRGFLTGQEKN